VKAVVFSAVLGDRRTAIQRSGTLDGGGSVTLDVGENDLPALAALMALAQTVLRVSIEVDDGVPAADTETPGQVPGAGKPRWARRG
jgi:hypothetical protein